jgi:hypothetical protein
VQAYYKIPNISRTIKTSHVDLKATIAYVDKQLELINMLLNYKIERLPKDIHPYADLHYRKAVKGKLPKSVAENPLNFFLTFHHLGNQWRLASNYKKQLYELIQSLKPIFKKQEQFDEEYERFDTSSEYFFHEFEDKSEHTQMLYSVHKLKGKQKNNNQKNQKNNNKQKRGNRSNDNTEGLTDMVFASDFKLEHAFGVQVTFIDDHGNYISMEDENSQQNTAKVERIVESVAKAVPFSEISNISLNKTRKSGKNSIIGSKGSAIQRNFKYIT